MTQVQVLDASPDRSGGYKVDVGRGQRVGRVSSEWFSRPADERYLSLDALMASVKGRAERSRTRTVESAAVRQLWRCIGLCGGVGRQIQNTACLGGRIT